MVEIMTMKNSKADAYIVLEAKPGDMIEFVRGLYSHWAIYIGNNEVIHRWGDNDGFGQAASSCGNLTSVYGVQFDKAEICKSKISDVLNYGGTARANNSLDTKTKPLPVRIILDRAKTAVGQKGYNLLYGNCEHFATDCRYGQAQSRQVQTAVAGSFVTGLVVAVTLFAGAYMLSNSSREENENKANRVKAIRVKK